MANELDAKLGALELTAEVSVIEETSSTLASEVLDIVQDGSFDYADVLKLFNKCLMELAGEFQFPDLERWEDLYTVPGVNHTKLPPDMMSSNIRFCHSITHNRKLHIQGSVIQMFRWYANIDRMGPVRMVAIMGSDLYYQLVPQTAEHLKINYYAYPQRLRTVNDKPTCLPTHLIEPLLIYYACEYLFNKIEDALEGPKPNTIYYNKKFQEAKVKLNAYLGPEEREPVEFPNELDYDALV
jgi:hypothetical protein